WSWYSVLRSVRAVPGDLQAQGTQADSSAVRPGQPARRSDDGSRRLGILIRNQHASPTCTTHGRTDQGRPEKEEYHGMFQVGRVIPDHGWCIVPWALGVQIPSLAQGDARLKS